MALRRAELARDLGSAIERLAGIDNIVDASDWYHEACVPLARRLRTDAIGSAWSCASVPRRAAVREAMQRWLVTAVEQSPYTSGHENILRGIMGGARAYTDSSSVSGRSP